MKLKKVTLNLYAGDLERLAALYDVPPSTVLRQLLHDHLRKQERKRK